MLRTAKVQAESTGKEVEMPKRGKNYKNAAAAIDRGTLYEVSEAMAKVVESGKAKFDETVKVTRRRAYRPINSAARNPPGRFRDVRHLFQPYARSAAFPFDD